jgi:hypothetical protein
VSETTVGLSQTSIGVTDGPVAITKDSAQYIAAAHHRNVEAGRLTRTYSVVTPVAGVAPGTALSTTPPLSLYNPGGSGVSVALLRAAMGYVSGTLGKGSLVLGALPSLVQDAPTGGTELDPQCSYFGYAPGRARAFQGATLDGTPQLVEPLFILGAWVGSADDVHALERRWHGTNHLAPGTCVCLQGIAGAGSSPLVLLFLELSLFRFNY